jgi:SAM-dependent methyltransferase
MNTHTSLAAASSTAPAAAAPAFDPARYKLTTREQWDRAAAAWHRYAPTLGRWLGSATEHMLESAGVGPGARVLDLAAGAGEQTLAILRRVGPSGYVLATDISESILAYAEQTAAEAGYTNFEARVMDGEELDVEPASFDVVVSRVGLIYFPNQQRALTGIKRALVPGGRLSAMVYATAEQNRFFSIPVSIIRKRAGLAAPAPGQPGPFSLGSPGTIEAAYTRAGFRDPKIETILAPLKFANAGECVRFERDSFGALHQMLASLDAAAQEAVWSEIARELRQFESTEGFVGPCEMIVATGTN